MLDRTGVGRSTFYLHYRNKDDLSSVNWKCFLNS